MNNFWLKQGGWVAAQVNGARWLGFAVPAFAGWSFASGCLLFITRRAGWSARPVAFTTVLAVGLIAGLAFRRMRRHWYTREDGLVHLDAVLGLHNRLSSAAAGVGQWPAPVLLANGGFRALAASCHPDGFGGVLSDGRHLAADCPGLAFDPVENGNATGMVADGCGR